MASPSSSSKRRLPWSAVDDGAGGQDLSRPRKRWRSLVLQVTGRRSMEERLFGFREIREEEFMTMFRSFFGSMVQRVVPEEVEKAIFRQFSAPTPASPRLLVGWNQRPRYQLMFLSGLKSVYTMTKLESNDGTAIKVAIVERLENQLTSTVRSGHLSSVKVEVVVLHGNFNAKNEESWTPEEFNKHIVSGREKSAQLLTGSLTLKLIGGEAFLENATFTDNSSFTSTKKFRLGLRLVNASGERVLEGVTGPFRVKERRVEGFEKHYPPMLDDKVWRLEKIGKNGPYHQALEKNGIDTVQKFLQAYMKDEPKLIQNFSKMPPSTWKSIVGHAMTCKLGDSLYLYEVKDKNASLFFNTIHKLVGVKFGDCYKPIDQLDQVEKNFVEPLKQAAYQYMNGLQHQVNNHPVLHRVPAPGTSLLSAVLPNQQILNYGQRNLYLGDMENFGTSLGANNVPIDIARFYPGQTSNDVQLRHESMIHRAVPHNSRQGAVLPGPRITQLQIRNTERTYLDPEASPPVVPSNILASQVAAQSDQYRQIERSQFFEGPYSCHSLDHLTSTDAVMSLMQSQFQLPLSSKHSEICNSYFTRLVAHILGWHLQTSRVNSFDLSSCDDLIQSFMSQFPNGGEASLPLSPRKWVKIRAALKLASVGRLSRALRRAPHCAPPRPRRVPTV